MRIVHVIPGLTHERGGPSVVLEAISRHQALSGHAVVVLTTNQGAKSGEIAVQLASGVEVHIAQTRGSDRWAYARGFKSLVRYALRRADVLHVHSLFTHPIHVSLRQADQAGVPVVVRPCGMLHPYSLRRSQLVKAIYLGIFGSFLQHVSSLWHYTSQQELRESWPYGDRKSFVLPNGVDPEQFNIPREAAQQAVWARHPELESRPYVLFLGRLHAKKRIDVLIKAFLASSAGDHKLIIAGPDQHGIFNRVLSEASLARHRKRVVKLGMVVGKEKVELLAGADLFALPSEHENFAVAALEALAAGTPVLLSPAVDLASAVAEAEIGAVEPIDIQKWRAAISRILTKTSQYTGLAPHRQQFVAQNYSWRTIVAQLDHQYDRIASTGRSTLCADALGVGYYG